MTKAKLAIIGAGNVGAQAAYIVAAKGLADIALIDIHEGVAQGKALDILQSTSISQTTVTVTAGKDYKLIKGADIVVITAGFPRKDGMTRHDLIEANTKVMKSIIPQVKKYAPNSKLIIVTNPLDAMVYLAKKLSKFPKERVMGMAGVLDTARFSTFIAQTLKVSPKDVSVLVIGEHGGEMIPLANHAYVGGIPLTDLLSSKDIQKIVDRTKKGGAEIVAYLQTGSAFFAPAAAIVDMVESILHDQKRVLPCSAYLSGQYGVKDVFLGVPCVLGSKGVEHVLEVKLTAAEKKSFSKAVKQAQAFHAEINKLA